MKDNNKTADETQALFDTKQAAKFLGISVRTLKYWRKSGKLVPDSIGETGAKRGPKTGAKYSLEQLKLVQTVSKRVQTSETGAKCGPKTGAKRGPKTGAKCSLEQLKLVQTVSKRVQTSETSAKSADEQQKLVSSSETGDKKGDNQSEKGCNKPDLVYVDDKCKKIAEEAVLIPASTYYSPKDKVSNLTWNNILPRDKNNPIITVQKSEDFGCIVRLNYDRIFADEHIITGADPSNFSNIDRAVYDAVVTIIVADNNVFNNTDIWRVITQNPNAKLTDAARFKIAKSMFHIGSFLISIITDYNEDPNAWDKINSNPRERPFKSERKFYKKLQSLYGGRLLEFRWLAIHSVTIIKNIDGQEVTQTEYVPEVWQFLAVPLLYKYAADKGQVASIAMNLLNITSKTEKKTCAQTRLSH